MTDLVPTRHAIVCNTKAEVETVLATAHRNGTLMHDPRSLPITRMSSGKWMTGAWIKSAPPKLTPAIRAKNWLGAHEAVAAIVKCLAFLAGVAAIGVGIVAAMLALIVHTVGLPTVGGIILFIVVCALVWAFSTKSHGQHSGYGYHYTKCK